jgi:hypothetical protein
MRVTCSAARSANLRGRCLTAIARLSSLPKLWGALRCVYGEEDVGTEVKAVDKCGLCGGDPMKKGNLKDAVLRLIPHVTARNIKRD